MWIKVDLHLHLKNEPLEKQTLGLKDPYWIINQAKLYKFNALAFACHGMVFYNDKLWKYAKERGITLVTATETYFMGKHLLIYGIEDVPSKVSLDDIENLKQQGAVVVAPHPFLSSSTSLGPWIVNNMEFKPDALELTHFSSWFWDINLKTRKLAEKLGIPLIAGSDTHAWFQFNTAYSYLEVEDINEKSILNSIRKGKIIPINKWLTPWEFTRELLWEAGNRLKRMGKPVQPPADDQIVRTAHRMEN
ncbi:MAG: PHP-associated domain-containing protein [bacterium]